MYRKRKRVGLIGCGAIGRAVAAAFRLGKIPGRLAAICDVRPAAAECLARTLVLSSCRMGVVVAFSFTTAYAVEVSPVQQTLALLRANLISLEDLSADVTVETKVKRIWTEQLYRQRYRYRFKRPSYIRMEYLEPTGRLVIARGKSIWAWQDGKLKEEGERSQEKEALFSLWGLAVGSVNLKEDFTVSSFTEPSHPNLAGLQITPKGRSMSVATVKVWVDKVRGVVDQVKVFGAEERLLSTSAVRKFERLGPIWLPVELVTYGCDLRCKTTIVYTNVELNRGLPDTLFAPSSVKQGAAAGDIPRNREGSE